MREGEEEEEGGWKRETGRRVGREEEGRGLERSRKKGSIEEVGIGNWEGRRGKSGTGRGREGGRGWRWR